MTNPLFDALFARHQLRGTTFLILPDGRRTSRAAFHGEILRMARALQAAGLKPGDRLAMQVAKSPAALALVAAAIRQGVVFLPLNTAYTPAEVGYFTADSGAGLLVCDPVDAEALAGLAPNLLTLDAEGQGSLSALGDGPGDPPPPAARKDDDLAALLYTSGTTGRSKGAMLSQRNLLSNAEVLVEAWRFTERDVLLHALPIYHTHGLFVAVNVALLAGCPMIFLPRFDVDSVLRWIPEATAMMGVPTFYTRLLDDPRLTRESVQHMRLFISGSAPLLAETHRSWEARTGQKILERYGMTETNMNTSNPYDGERRPGTVGLPLAGVEVRICDEAGRDLPAGETGMIEVRGPNVFSGYWNMPDKTREELRPSGFFITGDLGVRDRDGYVTIVGRAKDLIISGGLNIYPKEVEMAIDAQPGVLESAVFGVPHPDFGEAVVAAVVPDRRAELSGDLLAGTLALQLAAFKRPKRILIVPELPRNAMGKVQKAVLRREHAGMFTPTG